MADYSAGNLFDWHRTHGQNVSRTLSPFRHQSTNVLPLAAAVRAGAASDARRSLLCPPRAATTELDGRPGARGADLREQYPRWGKAKLQCCLARAETPVELSVSMVGRILRRLRASGQLFEPPRRVRTAPLCWTRPYGLRKPTDYVVQAPGDLVQVDTVGPAASTRGDPETLHGGGCGERRREGLVSSHGGRPSPLHTLL